MVAKLLSEGGGLKIARSPIPFLPGNPLGRAEPICPDWEAAEDKAKTRENRGDHRAAFIPSPWPKAYFVPALLWIIDMVSNPAGGLRRSRLADPSTPAPEPPFPYSQPTLLPRDMDTRGRSGVRRKSIGIQGAPLGYLSIDSPRLIASYSLYRRMLLSFPSYRRQRFIHTQRNQRPASTCYETEPSINNQRRGSRLHLDLRNPPFSFSLPNIS